MFSGKTVLVTGAGGFIGSHLVEELVAQGAHVRAFLRYTSGGARGCLEDLPLDRAREVEEIFGDVRDPDTMRRVIQGSQIVFHLAALVGIPYSYAHPREVFDTNINGTANVLLAARENEGVERVVLTSSSEVYGSARYVPMDEQHPVQSQSPYAASKIAADALGISFQRSFQMPVTIVRPFNAYGPRQSARAVIPTIISQALADQEVRLGSLDSRRDFTYVSDTVAGFIALARSEGAIGEVVNIGSGQEISIGDLVRKIGELTSREVEVAVDAQRLRPPTSEVRRLWADNSKARELAGWTPRLSLDEGLKKTVQWIAEHQGRFEPSVYAT